MRVTCCLCGKPSKAKCDGSKGGLRYKGPLCAAHYGKLLRNGDPELIVTKGPPKGRPLYRVGGERYKKGDGYIIVYMPSHTNANKNGYIAEHTLVMSDNLKRPLFKNESVHHINGVKDDNRLENLELWVTPPRKGVRFQEAILDCIEFLEQYGYKIYIPF